MIIMRFPNAKASQELNRKQKVTEEPESPSRFRTLAVDARFSESARIRRSKMSEAKETGFERLKQSVSKNKKFWAFVGIAAVAGGIGYKY